MLKRIAFVFTTLLLIARVSFSAPGDLDPSFGTNGLVFYESGRGNEEARGVAIQADGKIVVVGYTWLFETDVLLLRYKIDGTLDNTFGTNGVVTYNGLRHDEGYGVALQPDGKIVVVGYTYSTDVYKGPNVLILRFNSDGTLDNTFGTNGVGSYGINTYDYGYAVALQPDGKIVVVGETATPGDTYAFVLRCNSDGTLDKTFGTNGVVIYNGTGGGDIAYGIAIQSNGKIVITGSSASNLLVLRLTSNGTLDDAFGAGGVVTYSSNFSTGRGVVLQPDEKIVVVGGSLVLRFEADGSLDDTFGTNGVASFSGLYAKSVALQSDNKILVGTSSTVLRYRSNGQLDPEFGNEGVAEYTGGGNTNGSSIALQKDGKVVVTGSSSLHDQYSDFDVLTLRLFGGDRLGGATLISPSGTITTVTPTYIWNAVPGATGYYLWVNDSTGNKIKQGYTPSAAGCPSGTGTCSVTPSTALAAGPGTWWVLTFGYGEVGPWSTGMNFTVAPPGQATLVSPSEVITNTTPTYVWNAVFDSTWYHLWVNDSTGNKINQWYRSADAGCPNGTGTCSVTSTTEVIGSCQWWIQTYNPAGFGPWSGSVSFTSPSTPPSAAIQVSPTGPEPPISDSTPTYIWNAVSNSTWYQLYVNDSTGNKIQQWYRTADLDCPDIPDVIPTCSVTPTTDVRGPGQWWVRTYNGAGFGPWSLPGMLFTAPTLSAPPAATQVSPSGMINDITPTYTWYAVSNTTWYQLWVGDSSGNKISQWYAAADAGCADGVGGVDTCSVTPTTEVVGPCQWYIRTYNSGGFGPWSIPGISFTVTPPPASTLVSPSGTITDTTPTYTWNAVLGATWYQLYVNDSTGIKILKWYTASEAGCSSGTGTCSVTPTPFVIGAGDWKIQTYNSAGYGAWSSSLSFNASSLSEEWGGILISISAPFEPQLLECTISQDGNNLSGTITVDQFVGDADLSGTISGNSAYLTFRFLYEGYYVTANLNLALTAFDENSFSGNYALTLCIYGYCMPGDSGTFFLTKQ